jgi:hypothetical protein
MFFAHMQNLDIYYDDDIIVKEGLFRGGTGGRGERGRRG